MTRTGHETFPNGPLSQASHPFKNLDHTEVLVSRYQAPIYTSEEIYYSMSKSGLIVFHKIFAEEIVTRDSIQNYPLIFKNEYFLYHTRSAKEIYNARFIFEIKKDLFLYAETGYTHSYDLETDNPDVLIDNLEALLVAAPLSEVTESLCEWLVDNDPIGFEILRRMSRDGLVAELEIEEEWWPYHDSESYSYRFFNQMTDYADSVKFRVRINEKHPLINMWIGSAISHKNPFKESKFENCEKRHPPMDQSIKSIGKLAESTQKNIREILDRVDKAMDHEEAESMTRQLRAFVEGHIFLRESEISAEIAKCLRLLARRE